MRRIRVLVGKPGLDGHDRGAKVVAAALRDAGMEVIYTGLHQSPEQIVEAALQEDVDVVALSILSGAHMTLFPEVHQGMRAHGIGDRLLTGGGIVPAEDMATLARQGVGRLFGPGSSTQDIAHYIREWFVTTHPGETLAPIPEPAPPGEPSFDAPFAGDAPLARSPSAPSRAPRRRATPRTRAAKSKASRTTRRAQPKARPKRRSRVGTPVRARAAAKPRARAARNTAATRRAAPAPRRGVAAPGRRTAAPKRARAKASGSRTRRARARR